MTPEAQQIAIEEACGWKGPQHHDTQKHIAEWPHSSGKSIWWLDPNGETQMISSVPDYLNDLNAMHEAEKVLTVGQMQRANYIDQLQIVVGTEGLHSYSAYTATAAQRAEAFLRTLNLWVGG